MQTTVELKKTESFWEMTLVAPGNKPPTLDYQVIAELEKALDEIEAAVVSGEKASPNCLIIKSSSDRCFCAGANIEIMDTLPADTMAEWVAMGHGALNRLEDLSIPVLTKLRSYALGGGLELALACDVIVCDPTAKLGITEANLGFVPGWGGTYRLPRRVGPSHAKRMFYTSEIVDADAALSFGLVDVVVGSNELDGWLENYAITVALKSAVGIRGFKSILNEQDHADREANLLAETERSLECISDSDTKRRIREFLDKESHDTDG